MRHFRKVSVRTVVALAVLTSAVTLALRERLAREHRRRNTNDVAARLMKIGSRYAALPDTGRTPDDILGYDDNGLPT